MPLEADYRPRPTTLRRHHRGCHPWARRAATIHPYCTRMGPDPEGIGKMCGIAGEYLLGSSGAVDPENIGPMLSVLGHRGPDDWGYYMDERRRAMLLHRRLSIVDLAGGHQPLSNEDGSIWTVFNGEIYDFDRQARRLERAGHRLATRCDTEVIVHLYEEYGGDFVEHLRGEFALALYDARRDELYLVRDRFGI